VHIFFDSVNLNSTSGPNSFAKKLIVQLNDVGHTCHCDAAAKADIQISFIQITQKIAPVVLRLDGVWFNTAQNWLAQNQPLHESYRTADAVIVQSDFNKQLTERYFGKHAKSSVIHNGTSLKDISKIAALNDTVINKFNHVWCCASSWRPHKRLKANVEYFLKHAGKNDCLVVAGENPDYFLEHERIVYTGQLNHYTLMTLYKRATYFLHLAFLDHCPNVVVDARAAGCHIICASSGGTHEIAGLNATVVQDIDWDFKPLKLYEPPDLDLEAHKKNDVNHSIDIKSVAQRYLRVCEEVLDK